MTTRRFSRTLLEAFPSHYPHSITRHRRPLSARVALLMKAATFAGVFVLMALYGLEALA